MKVKIYRGTHRIGGTITGNQTDRTRILIDMGSPRMDIDEPYDAVIFTHYHGDYPSHIIPIHTAVPENLRLGSLQNRILHLEDGDSYDIL